MQEVLQFKTLKDIQGSNQAEKYSIDDIVKLLDKDFGIRVNVEDRVLSERKVYTLKSVTSFSFKDNITETEAIFFLKGMYNNLVNTSKFTKAVMLD